MITRIKKIEVTLIGKDGFREEIKKQEFFNKPIVSRNEADVKVQIKNFVKNKKYKEYKELLELSSRKRIFKVTTTRGLCYL